MKGVAFRRPEGLTSDVVSAEWAEAWKHHVIDDLVPRYWPSLGAGAAALQEQANLLLIEASRVEGLAEEHAVDKALKPGGILDRTSVLRTRVQRVVDRDRATYATLRERGPADDYDAQDDREVDTDCG